MFEILVFIMCVINLVLYVKLNNMVERLGENLVDFEVIYLKQQRVMRDIRDIFAVAEEK